MLWLCRMPPQPVPAFVTDSKMEVLTASINLERSWNRSLLSSIKANLEQAGYGPARTGATVSGGVVHIDLLLEALMMQDKPVVVELLDGYHVASNTGQPLGRWLLRRRLLESFGFHVVTVAEDVWLAAPSPTELLASMLNGCRRVPHALREHKLQNRISFVETIYYAHLDTDASSDMHVFDE